MTGKTAWSPHYQQLVRIRDASGATIDQAMLAFHPAPHSYTGEDLAEISCHGNPLIVKTILDAIRATGLARPAQKGEFTRRAYLNGKLDLAQAEAVGALIEAQSLTGIEMARNLLAGDLSVLVQGIAMDLQDIRADIEASFIAEDIEFDEDSLIVRLGRVIDRLEGHARAAAASFYQGLTTIIAGLPNAGKSSLFNVLLGFNRAIVHEEEGTTRDIIREHVILNGIDFMFHDTAGIRDTSTGPERIGIDRTIEAIRESDLLLYVVDAVKGIQDDEFRWLALGRKTIVVMNKMDLSTQAVADIPGVDTVRISARCGQGIDDLLAAMHRAFPQDLPQVFLERHVYLLHQALDALNSATGARAGGLTMDVLTLDIQRAIQALKAIIGEESSEDILDSIFSRFCVGK
jgi:tRNA modification GTPase